MKKFLLAAVVLLSSISLANAERFSMGVTLTGAVFEADGASEIFSGDHAGDATSTKVTKTLQTKVKMLKQQAMGSIFFEAALTDNFL